MNTYLMRLNIFRKDVLCRKDVIAFTLGIIFSKPFSCLTLILGEVFTFKSAPPLFREIWLSSFNDWWQLFTMPVSVFAAPMPAMVALGLTLSFWHIVFYLLFCLWKSFSLKNPTSSFKERWLCSIRKHIFTWPFMKHLFLYPILIFLSVGLILSSADALKSRDHKTLREIISSIKIQTKEQS